MIRIIMAFVFIICPTAFAYVSGKLATDEKTINCPSVVHCTENDVKFCNFESEDNKHFGKLTQTGTILTDNLFSGAKTTFHSDAINGVCSYKNLDLEIKPDANLEAFYKKLPSSAWVINGSNASCTASSPSLCPLKNRLGFIIHNIDLPEGVLASINGNDINRLIGINSYKSLLFDDALVGCSSLKECTIDVLSKNHVIYGSVKIDMDTMNVIEVSSADKTIEINKMDVSNIEMKKIDRERAVYCPSSVNCISNSPSTCAIGLIDEKYFKPFSGNLSRQNQTLQFYSSYYDNVAGGYYCEYHDASSPNDKLRLHTNPKSYLIPHTLHPDSKWVMKPHNDDCITSKTEDCPLKKSFGFVVNNTNVSNGIFVSIKDRDINDRPIPNYSIITFDNVMLGCSGEKECVIDLSSDKHAKYGSVTVEIDSMKVLRASSMYPAYIGINKTKNDLYENVEIGYVSR